MLKDYVMFVSAAFLAESRCEDNRTPLVRSRAKSIEKHTHTSDEANG